MRKAFQGRSRGISAIEVLIAVAIIGTIAITFLSGLSTASMALIIADERATAESLARSQMEYVKNQDYYDAPPGGEAIYLKITGIPDGYNICSVDRDNETVNCGATDDVIGIPWNSGNNTDAYEDNGLQSIKLVIEHHDEVVITLEDYKRAP